MYTHSIDIQCIHTYYTVHTTLTVHFIMKTYTCTFIYFQTGNHMAAAQYIKSGTNRQTSNIWLRNEWKWDLNAVKERRIGLVLLRPFSSLHPQNCHSLEIFVGFPPQMGTWTEALDLFLHYFMLCYFDIWLTDWIMPWRSRHTGVPNKVDSEYITIVQKPLYAKQALFPFSFFAQANSLHFCWWSHRWLHGL